MRNSILYIVLQLNQNLEDFDLKTKHLNLSVWLGHYRIQKYSIQIPPLQSTNVCTTCCCFWASTGDRLKSLSVASTTSTLLRL